MFNQKRRKTLQQSIGLAGALVSTSFGVTAGAQSAASSPDRLVIIDGFPSQQIQARKVSVWLPPNYDANTDRYTVLYMHDGQNLFDPVNPLGGPNWGIVEAMTMLLGKKAIRRTIVVGVNNSPLRWREYAPTAAVRLLSPAALEVVAPNDTNVKAENLLADHYLRFLVTELKPYIDKNFRTKPDQANTFVMGSSMGGLISLYALSSYPEVFGGAGCVSTHWPLSTNRAIITVPNDARREEIGNAYFKWLAEHLPEAGKHRIYFDHGTINLDSLYAPHQLTMDALMSKKGYRRGLDWITQVFPGADHNEQSWRERVEIPLQFLLRE